MTGCLIYTCAYNAEKTLPRVAKSIMAQTYKDWTWYCLDNGSTDDTGDYIKSLAKKDSRIKYLHNEKNYVWEKGNTAKEVINNNSTFDYFCWIDSDDAYEPTFIEEMTQYLEKNNVDIVTCTHKNVSSEDDEVISTSALDFKGIINTKENFDKFFPYYHHAFRTYWGKMFRVPVLLKTETDQFPNLYYGWDTLFCLEAVINSESISTLDRPLYRYYLSNKSSSYHYDSSRIDSDRLLFENALSFLNRKCGRVSTFNLIFLLLVFLNAIHDTYNVLINSDLEIPKKIKELHRLVISKYTNLFLTKQNVADGGMLERMDNLKNSLFTQIASWLLTCTEVPDEMVEDYVDTGEMACTVIKNTDGWVYFEKIRIQFLILQKRLDEAKEKLVSLESLLPNDDDLEKFKGQLA